ncbi:MAG: SAM-dependent methyltransferase, partial [Rhodanobacter sp.]
MTAAKSDSTPTSAEASFTALRPGEATAPLPGDPDQGVYFIGRIRTPWASLDACPKRGDIENGPVCRVEVDPRWAAALTGIEAREYLQILYWMHRARRDLTLQNPHSDGNLIGTFALRSPSRPNPVAASVVRLVGVEGATLMVR